MHNRMNQQSAPTATTARRLTQFLDYAASHPNSIITYNASGMVLHIHSDASYLSAPNARSRVGGHFYLSDKPADPSKTQYHLPLNHQHHHIQTRIILF